MCDRDCFNCPYPDCRLDGYDYAEKRRQDRFDNDLKPHDATYQHNHTKSHEESQTRYNNSLKGKERLKRYNSTEKGKERFRRYYQKKKLKGVV